MKFTAVECRMLSDIKISTQALDNEQFVRQVFRDMNFFFFWYVIIK